MRLYKKYLIKLLLLFIASNFVFAQSLADLSDLSDLDDSQDTMNMNMNMNTELSQNNFSDLDDTDRSTKFNKPNKTNKSSKSSQSNSNTSNSYSNSFETKNTTAVRLDKSETSDNSKRIWNLDNVDILALIGEISRITGRNFIIDTRVTGTASLVSNTPMTNEEAYQAFLSILQVLNFSVVESGSVTKIVPDSVAKQLETKVNVKNLKSLGDEMVVQVIKVKHVTASALIPILRSLVNQQGQIAPYAPSNVIVIADHAKNVARIAEIIERIDTQGSDDVDIVTLKDASADEVVKVLTNLMSKNQQLGEPPNQQIKLASDVRTNSILISGDKTKRLKTRALIVQMDVPTPRNGDTEVIYLQYQNAETLVPVIGSVIDVYYGKTTTSSESTTNTRRSSGGPSRAGSYGNTTQTTSTTTSTGATDAAFGSTFDLPDTRRGQEGNLSAPGVRAETNTNSLVISAPPELMRSIKSVIAKLDIRRYQVLVEALIVEVALAHIENLGVEWRVSGSHSNSAVKGGSNLGNPTSSVSSADGLINGVLAGTANAFVTGKLPLSGATIGFLRGSNIQAVLYALEQDINTNILSTPSIVTMDNETAEITVTDNIPFKTQEAISTSTAGAPTVNSFTYKDVGLNLKITPMITKGDAVKLSIEQTTGNVKGDPGNPTPTTSRRTVKTVVSVNDKDVLVLGGLIQGQKDIGVSKVPILGDLPLIGNLFRRTTDTLTKKNLMVFIRPVIIRTTEESNNVSLSKYDFMRDSQLLYDVDPVGKIAPQLMPKLADFDPKDKGNRNQIKLPTPFASNFGVDDVTGFTSKLTG